MHLWLNAPGVCVSVSVYVCVMCVRAVKTEVQLPLVGKMFLSQAACGQNFLM